MSFAWHQPNYSTEHNTAYPEKNGNFKIKETKTVNKNFPTTFTVLNKILGTGEKQFDETLSI
jgi:hypothetical protein